MRSLVQVRFRGSDKLYDYYAEGSSNELAGFRKALVDTPSRDNVEVDVYFIRPLSEQVFDGKLKPIKEFLKDEEIQTGGDNSSGH